jgi:polar amino acid transport system permease protein
LNLDWAFIATQLPDYGHAILTTIGLGGLAVLLSWLLGVGNAVASYFGVGRSLITAYVEIGRNTPLLIQLFLLYFGLPKLGILLSAEACGVLALTFLGGAYFTEIYRVGFASIPVEQAQAAKALGLSNRQLLTLVLWPQVWQRQLPAAAATGCFLLRETTVLSAIAVAEIMYTTTNGIALYYLTYEFLLMMTLCCFILFVPLSMGLRKLEARL